MNKSKVSKSVGLKPNVMSTYIAKGVLPRADIAFKIARALDVPLSWLVDDAQGWPPPKITEKGLTNATDEELMREACRRLENVVASIESALKQIEKTDWKTIARNALQVPTDAPLPPEIEHQKRLAEMLEAGAERLVAFDASEQLIFYSEARVEHLNLRLKSATFATSEDKNIAAFLRYNTMRRLRKSETEGFPPSGYNFEKERLRLLASLSDESAESDNKKSSRKRR